MTRVEALQKQIFSLQRQLAVAQLELLAEMAEPTPMTEVYVPKTHARSHSQAPKGTIVKKLLCCIAAVSLSGCFEPTPETVTPADSQKMVDTLTYVKAKNGVCYAVGSYQRVDSGGHFSQEIVLTYVPCDQVPR